MATSGENAWAGLIAKQKIKLELYDEVKSCYLSFHFGRYIHFYTKRVPLREFADVQYEWPVPSRIRPVCYIHFVFRKESGLLSEEIKFRLVWNNYIWKPLKGGGSLCILLRTALRLVLIAPTDGRYAGFRKLYLRFPGRSPRLYRKVQGQSVTPTQLFNLSLIAGVLAPKGLKPRVRQRRVRGPYTRKPKSARPNPEIYNATFKTGLEIYPSVPYTEGVQTLERFRRDWTGSVTPNFGSKLKSQLPVNPHTVTLVRTNYSTGYDLRRRYADPNTSFNNGWDATYWPIASPSMSNTESQFTQVENKAIKNLNANANVGVTSNMAQNIAQYSQTTNMIANTAARLSRSILALKKGRFTLAADLLFDGAPRKSPIKVGSPSRSKSLANNWLELQYGWKPLLSDIDESMQSLANYLQGSGGFQQVKGVSTLVRKNRVPLYGPGSNTIGIGYESSTSLWSCRFGCRYRVSSPLTSFLSQLGFTNPINLVWEILPYSFVVDWFIPIGPYLESMSAPHGLEFQTGYKTRFGRRITTTSVSHSGPMPGAITSELRAYMERERESVSFVRATLSAWPVQSFPQFKNPFSTVHAANALALLKQAFK